MSLDPTAGRATLRSPLVPPLLTLGVILLLQFAAQLFQVGLAVATDTPYQPPYPIARMSLAQADFRMIYAGNQAFLAGARDHDAVRQYVANNEPWNRKYPYPPIVYRLFAGVNLLSKPSAHHLWLLAIPLCVVLSLLATARVLVPSEGGEARLVIVLMLLGLLGSTPLVFQIERGNFDWVVFALYLTALAGLLRNHPLSSGVLIGLATSLKLYPGILLPCLLLCRRLKPTLAALGTMLAVVVVTGPNDNWHWLKALAEDRARSFGLHPCNAGLANLIGTLGVSDGTALARVSYAAFLLLVVSFLAVIFLRQRRASVDVGRIGLIAIPFMFLMPLTHWAYALFALLALLPLLSALYREREDLRPQILAVSVLIGVTQAPFVALRSFPAGLPIVMPVYSACVLCLSLLSIWLVAGGAADAPRATPSVSV